MRFTIMAAASVGGFLLTLSPPVQALFESVRYDPAHCVVTYDEAGFTGIGGGLQGAYHDDEDDPAPPYVRAWCPIRDDDYQPKEDISNAYVYVRNEDDYAVGFDASHGVFYVNACSASNTGAGAYCGTYDTSVDDDTMQRLDLSGTQLTYWGSSYATYRGYLNILIPPYGPFHSNEYHENLVRGYRTYRAF